MSKSKLLTKTFTLPNGQRKYVRAKSKEELEAKIAALKFEMKAGVDITDNTTVGEFIQIWVDTYKRPYLAQSSIDELCWTINKIIIPTLGDFTVRSVKPVHIQRMMANASSYSHRTQSKTITVTRAIFNAAVDNGMLLRSPVPTTIKAHGAPTEKKVPLTREQSARLLDATRGHRIHSAIVAMLGLGLRREEALALMWTDIDFNKHQVHVQRTNVFHGSTHKVSTDMKTAAANRIVPMARWVETELKAVKCESSSLYVCPSENGSVMTPGSFNSAWNAIRVRTTFDPDVLGTAMNRHPDIIRTLDFHVHPHLLRHTCATRWIELGFNPKEVQYMLGHSTPDLTMRVYAHYDAAGQLSETTAKMQALM